MTEPRYALVTGASSGLGLALAGRAAEDGYTPILVAQRPRGLEEAAARLERDHGVRCTSLPCDLANRVELDRLLRTLEPRLPMIGMLINNAGIACAGPCVTHSWYQEQRVLDLNATAVLRLSRHFGAVFAERGEGYILNVASLAAFQPGPHLANYYATKAYVLHFTEGLAHELRPSGVRVCALCPGTTATGFHERAGLQGTSLARGLFGNVMRADAVSRIGYAGLKRGRTVIVPGALNRLARLGTRLAPRALVSRITARMNALPGGWTGAIVPPLALVLTLALALAPTSGAAFDASIGLELRHFPEDGLFAEAGPRFALHAELVDDRYVLGDDWLFDLRLAARVDPQDSSRDKLDARTLSLSRFAGNWEFAFGVEEVFWGVVESSNIVNIVNQLDNRQDAGEKARLGQPMLRAGYAGRWGTLDAYALIGFREREYGAEGSRLTLPFVTAEPRYKPSSAERSFDIALRWQHAFGDTSFALSHFRGTARRPYLDDVETGGTPGAADFSVRLVPFYDELAQWGGEAQLIGGSTLYKGEVTHRRDSRDASWAAVVGVEHTVGQILSSRADLGLIAEYLYDERGEEAPVGVFEHDLLLALRLALNDAASSAFTFGVLWDHRTDDIAYRLDGAYRLRPRLTLDVDLRLFDSGPSLSDDTTARLGELAGADPSRRYAFVNDEDYIGLGLTYYLD